MNHDSFSKYSMKEDEVRENSLFFTFAIRNLPKRINLVFTFMHMKIFTIMWHTPLLRAHEKSNKTP